MKIVSTSDMIAEGVVYLGERTGRGLCQECSPEW